MAAIGNSPTQQAFTPAIDYFSGNGSTTAFTLSRPVASVAQVQVTIDNVAQNPSSAYTVSGSTITFTSAPLSGTNNIYVYYTSPITQVIAPGQGTVTATSFVSSTGTGAGVFQTSPTITTPVISSLSSASATALTLQSAGTTAVTIDTSQNVGIGTTSPSYKLHVVSSSASTPLLIDGGTNTYFGIKNSSQTAYLGAVGTVMYFENNGSERMRIDSSGSLLVGTTTAPTTGGFYRPIASFKQLNDSGYASGIQLEASGNTNVLGIGYNGDTFQFGPSYRSTGSYVGLSFSTSNAERMRIDSSGRLLVGTPNTYNGSCTYQQRSSVDSNQVHSLSNSSTTSPYIAYWEYPNASPNNGASYYLQCSDNAGTRLYFRSNGGLSNYQANDTNLSDRREKTNFAPAKPYLDTICAIPVQTFNYIDQNMEEDGGLTLGVVAQDVQAVAPELVSESNWASKDEPEKMRLSVYQTDLQYALMKSIQELKAINDTQAETINALTARIEALEGK